ncbi:MAG: hypothetical protein ABF293_09305 [Flavobacteriaceae bacterium]
MKKLWVFILLSLLIFSCKPKQDTGLLEENPSMEFRADELPQRNRVNSKSAKILNGWVEYNAFDASFGAVYNATNREDLILTIDDLLEKQKIWYSSAYPDQFDKAQIRSRQKVLRTYLLKVKISLNYRTDFQAATVEMIDAYNALRNQFDVMVNSTLDPKLLSDEE